MWEAVLDRSHTAAIDAANWLDTPWGHGALGSLAVVVGCTLLKRAAWPATKWSARKAWRVFRPLPAPPPETHPVTARVCEMLAGDGVEFGPDPKKPGVNNLHAGSLAVDLDRDGAVTAMKAGGQDVWMDRSDADRALLRAEVQKAIARVEERHREERDAAALAKLQGRILRTPAGAWSVPVCQEGKKVS